MSNSIWDHPIETIEKALHIRKQIVALQSSLDQILAELKGDVRVKNSDRRRNKRSAATRAKMAAAQRARWAKKKSAPAIKTPRKKRVVSKTSRANMAAAQRARRSKEKIDPLLNAGTNLVW